MNRLRERYVADLANTLGNLVQRAVAMSRRYFDRRVPDVEPDAAALAPDASVWRGREGIEEIERVYDGHMEQTRIDLALQAIWSAGLDKASGLEQANRYIEETKPFQLVKTDAPKVSEILYSLLEALRRHAWLLEPVMPETSAAIIRALGQDVRIERRKTLTELRTWGVLKPGSALPEPIPLFPRVE
jgi:methionyl-tRNA synthetase